MNKAISEKLEHSKRLDIGEIKEILDTEETYEVPINGKEILAYFSHNGHWYRITYATYQHAEVIRGQKAEEVTEQQLCSAVNQ